MRRWLLIGVGVVLGSLGVTPVLTQEAKAKRHTVQQVQVIAASGTAKALEPGQRIVGFSCFAAASATGPTQNHCFALASKDVAVTIWEEERR